MCCLKRSDIWTESTRQRPPTSLVKSEHLSLHTFVLSIVTCNVTHFKDISFVITNCQLKFCFYTFAPQDLFKQWIRDTTPILRFFVPNALLPTFVDRCSFGGDLDWMPNGAWIGEGLFVNYESNTTIHWSKTVLIESYTMLYPLTAGHLELQVRPVGFRLWPCQGGDADWSVDDLRFGAGTWTWYSLWFDEISVWHLVAWKNMEEQTDGSICCVFLCGIGIGINSMVWTNHLWVCACVNNCWIYIRIYIYIYTHSCKRLVQPSGRGMHLGSRSWRQKEMHTLKHAFWMLPEVVLFLVHRLGIVIIIIAVIMIILFSLVFDV